MANENEGQAGGAGTEGAAGAAAGTGAAATGTAAGTGAATSEGTARTGAASGFTYKEDRTDWVPKHRFNEVNTKAQRVQELEAAIKDRDTKIAALAGVTTPDPNAAKADQVKEAFFKMFPNMKAFADLSSEQMQKLLAAPDQAAQANQFVSQGWAKHAKTMVTTLVEEVSSAIGGTLSERAQGRVKAAFGASISAEVQKHNQTGEVSPLLQRYLDGDETLVQEFAKEWAEDYFTPARRQVTSQEVNRVNKRVPSSTGRSQVSTVQRPTEFKSLDERLEYATKLAKERGVQFGQN